MKRVLIAGGSIAGISAARALRSGGFSGEIRMVDADTRVPYRRPEVSKGLIDGHLTTESIATAVAADLEVLRTLDTRLLHLDLDTKVVTVDGPHEDQIAFDGLVIATGSVARPSPYPAHVSGVHTLRNVEDADRMRKALSGAQHLVIIGGGFIGLEVAAVARGLGKDVTVVETAGVPLAHILGDTFGSHIAGIHRRRGVRVLTGVHVTELETDVADNVEGVLLSDGSRMLADLVLVAIGSAPELGWLNGSGLELSNGVVCDRGCAAGGRDDVVAAGDVASWINPLYDRRMRVEHWTNAIEQGAYAARRLLGVHDPRGFVSVPYFWSDQYGMRLQSLGSPTGFERAFLIEHDHDRMVMAYSIDDRLVCVAGIGAGATVMGFRKHLLNRTRLGEIDHSALGSSHVF